MDRKEKEPCAKICIAPFGRGWLTAQDWVFICCLTGIIWCKSMLIISTFWINITNSIQTEGNPSGNKRVGLEDCVGLSVYLLSTWPQLVLGAAAASNIGFLVGFHYFCATILGNLISWEYFAFQNVSPHHDKMDNNRKVWWGSPPQRYRCRYITVWSFLYKTFSRVRKKLNAQFTVIADLAWMIWIRES